MKRPPVSTGLLVAGFIFATAADSQLHSQELYTAPDSAYYSSAFDHPDMDLIKRREAAFAAARNTEIETSLAAYAANRQRMFETARNAEIEASLAAVNARREAEFAAARNAEIEQILTVYWRERRAEALFAATRNAEIEISVAMVKYRREQEAAFEAARNAEIEVSVARAKARREADFVAARNAEIEASVTLSQTRLKQEREFAAARNAEIEVSIARAKARRDADFEMERNAEINASVRRIQDERDFAAARNAEIDASVVRSQAVLNAEREFVAARNAEIEASVAKTKAFREAEFARARNAEIEASLEAYNMRRDYDALVASFAANRSEEYVPSTSYRIATPEPVCPLTIGSVGVIQFDSSSSSFEPTEADVLARVIDLAQQCPHLTIEISGHTDSSGSDRANQRLSERRAELTAEHLLIAGIEPDRISIVGYGARSPLAPNNTAENRARNRRIEIGFKRKGQTPVRAASNRIN